MEISQSSLIFKWKQLYFGLLCPYDKWCKWFEQFIPLWGAPFGVYHGFFFPLTYAVLSYLKLIAVQYFKVSSHGANLKCFGSLNHTWKTSSSAYPSSREQLNILRRLASGPPSDLSYSTKAAPDYKASKLCELTQSRKLQPTHITRENKPGP